MPSLESLLPFQVVACLHGLAIAGCLALLAYLVLRRPSTEPDSPGTTTRRWRFTQGARLMGTGGPDPRLAVIGMAFRLPGADTPEDLWRVIRNGERRFTRFSRDELKAAGVPEELYRRDDFIGTSAVLDDISGFDARRFGIERP
ncbi:hypothetical protein SMICM304S_07597 [Streptomyces microflavus]